MPGFRNEVEMRKKCEIEIAMIEASQKKAVEHLQAGEYEVVFDMHVKCKVYSPAGEQWARRWVTAYLSGISHKIRELLKNDGAASNLKNFKLDVQLPMEVHVWPRRKQEEDLAA